MPARMLVVYAVMLAVPAPPASAQIKSDTLLAVADYLDWERVSDPQISPGGAQILYTRRRVDKQKDRWDSQVW